MHTLLLAGLLLVAPQLPAWNTDTDSKPGPAWQEVCSIETPCEFDVSIIVTAASPDAAVQAVQAWLERYPMTPEQGE